MTYQQWQARLDAIKADPAGTAAIHPPDWKPTLSEFPWFVYAEACMTAVYALGNCTADRVWAVPDDVVRVAEGAFGAAAHRWVREMRAADR